MPVTLATVKSIHLGLSNCLAGGHWLLSAAMAISDRSYMQESHHPPSFSKWLIIVLIVAFLLQCILLFYGEINLNREFALSRGGLMNGKIWQLITFQFLHSAPSPFHVLFNCLGIYFFGRRVEQVFGSGRFLGIYFTSGVIGGLLQVLLTLLPRHVDAPVVGASAGVCGLIAVFCSIYPMEELQTWIYFFPITIRAHWLLKFLFGFSVFGALIPFDNVAHGAHLGGILLGMGYAYGGERSDRILDWLIRPFRFTKRTQTSRLAKNTPWPGNKAKSINAADSFISREVDPILDKISAQGFDSLTEKERAILEAARKRMR